MPLFAHEKPEFRAATELPVAPPRTEMSIPQAMILGIVEGVTEYLPVSSTGHLNVVQSLLGLWATPEEKSASDAYAICIQAGAIIAVFLISFGRIRGMVRGLFGQDREGLRQAGNLVVAFIPAALIGLLLEKTIKQHLYGIWPVAAAWLVGGIFILAVLTSMRGRQGLGIEGLTWRTALLIGLAQVLSLWPGVSRSLVTIAGGMFVGLSVSAAVEFSFLLGLVTLAAATLYEGLKLGHLIVSTFGVASPLIGLLTAAVSAFIAIRWMVEYLKTRSLAIFGWYRIAIAILVSALALAGVVR
jgi:undecaprenyl-diphosphatase